MILNNSQENLKLNKDNYKVYVPKISKDDGHVDDSTKENIEFDLDIKIWIKKN